MHCSACRATYNQKKIIKQKKRCYRGGEIKSIGRRSWIAMVSGPPASMTLQLCPALPPHSWKVSLSHWASDLLQTWAQGTFLRKKEILLSSQKNYTRYIKGQTVWWQSWQIIELRWCQWLGIGSVKFASLEKSLAKRFLFFFFNKILWILFLPMQITFKNAYRLPQCQGPVIYHLLPLHLLAKPHHMDISVCSTTPPQRHLAGWLAILLNRSLTDHTWTSHTFTTV